MSRRYLKAMCVAFFQSIFIYFHKMYRSAERTGVQFQNNRCNKKMCEIAVTKHRISYNYIRITKLCS